MKFQVFICVFVIALGIVVEAGRSRGSSRSSGSRGSSRGSGGSSRPVYHPPPRTPVYHPPVQSAPIYHPPVHVPAPPPKSVSKPGATSPKDDSNIFIHNEGGGRPRPAPTNDHKQTNPSAPHETISRVNAPATQNSPQPDWRNPGIRQPPLSSPIGNGHPPPNQPYPDWANPGAKPMSPPLGLPTGNSHPPYPVPNPHPSIPHPQPSFPSNSQPPYPHPGAPYPNSHSSNMPMPNTPHIGFQPGVSHGAPHQPPLGSPHYSPPLGSPHQPPLGSPHYSPPLGSPHQPSMGSPHYGQGTPYPVQPGYPGGYHPSSGSPVIHNHYHMNSQPSNPGYGQSPMPGGSYVPQTIILPSQSSSGPGIGQLVKEALVFSTINAGVNRIINGAPHQYHSSSPPAQPAVVAGSTTSIVNNTTIITNTYGSSDQPTSGGNGNLVQGTYVPNNPGTYSSSPGASNNPVSYPPIGPGSGLPASVPIIPGAPPTGPTGVNIGTRVDAPPSNLPSSSSPTNGSVLVPNAGNTDSKNVNTTAVPVASPEYYISEEELKNLTEILFAKEEMDLKRYITLNVQKKSTDENITDQAPQSLMYISPDLYDLPTIQAFKNLFDNYEFNSTLKENSTQETRREESLLLESFMNTDVMLTAMTWLATKYYIESDDFEIKDTLRHIWFNKLEGSTSGFERVFLAERYPEKILVGAQNWIYFHHKEAAGDINYMGYTEERNVAEKAWLLKVNMKMGDIVKQNLTMLIGVSPELEMSLYTVCFYARPNDICPVSLGGNMFYLYTHTVRSFGKDIIDVGIKAF